MKYSADWLLEYYTRTPPFAASSVIAELEEVAIGDRERVIREIVETIPASRILSVSDVVECIRRIGAKLRAKPDTRAPYSVTCPVCGKPYEWLQGGGPHGFDCCPSCKYPYYETFVAAQYRAMGKTVFDEWEKTIIRIFKSGGQND